MEKQCAKSKYANFCLVTYQLAHPAPYTEGTERLTKDLGTSGWQAAGLISKATICETCLSLCCEMSRSQHLLARILPYREVLTGSVGWSVWVAQQNFTLKATSLKTLQEWWAGHTFQGQRKGGEEPLNVQGQGHGKTSDRILLIPLSHIPPLHGSYNFPPLPQWAFSGQQVVLLVSRWFVWQLSDCAGGPGLYKILDTCKINTD